MGILNVRKNINTRDRNGWTALMDSAGEGRLTPELLDVFMTYGADVNARNNEGNTALIVSAANGYLTPQLLEAFVVHGEDINAHNKYGSTALMRAVSNKKMTPELMEAFVRLGADINSRNHEGHTALSLALAAKNKNDNDVSGWDIVLLLFLRHGARIDFNEQYIQGLLPAVVRYLLETTESCPSLAVKIIREQPEGMLEQWLEQGVPGTEELLAKAAFMLGKNQKDRNGEFVVMEF